MGEPVTPFFPPNAPPPAHDEKYVLIARKLEEIRDFYPDEDGLLFWACAVMAHEELRDKVLPKLQSNISVEQTLLNIKPEQFLRLYQDDKSLIDYFRHNIFTERSDMDSHRVYDLWNKNMQGCVVDSSTTNQQAVCNIKIDSYHFRFVVDDCYISDSKEQIWNKYKGKRGLYEQHKRAFDRIEAAESQTIHDVFAAIDRMKLGRPPSLRQKQESAFTEAASAKPLQIPVPHLSDEDIAARIAGLKPNSYDDITGFGLDLQRAFADAVRQITDYFINHSARPAQTLGRVEDIMQASGAQDGIALPPMPRNAFDRFSGRVFGVRLVSPDDMPFSNIIKMAADLPERAKQDDVHLSQDLKIVDHAAKICIAYADIIDRARKAFEADRDRLTAIDDTSLQAGALAAAAIPALFEEKAQSLQQSALFLNHQAHKFSQIGLSVGHLRTQLGSTSALSVVVQTPALDAIHTFNLYQLKRLRAFGRTVNEAVLQQLGMNDNVLAEIGAASEDDTLENLARVRTHLNETFTALSGNMRETTKNEIELARQINADTISHFLAPKKAEP